eukprot:15483551-Alexandrium_andersonii.AAC.1
MLHARIQPGSPPAKVLMGASAQGGLPARAPAPAPGLGVRALVLVRARRMRSSLATPTHRGWFDTASGRSRVGGSCQLAEKCP